MNYNKIVLKGILEKNSEENLKHYFRRQYKIALEKHYTLEEFFEGCIVTAEYFNDYLETTDEKRKHFSEESFVDSDSEFFETWMRHIKTEDTLFIALSEKRDWVKIIKEVKEEFEPKKKTRKSTNITPLDFELKASEIVYLFEILQRANFLVLPKFHDDSYYQKLETFFTAYKKPIKNAVNHRHNSLKGGYENQERIKKKLIEAINSMF